MLPGRRFATPRLLTGIRHVTEEPAAPDNRRPVDFEIDTTVTSPARLYNYLAGGEGNFSVDRETAEQVAARVPGGLDTIRIAVQSVSDFTRRTVLYLVEEAGVRQFLCIGTPVPAGGEVHEIAQRVAPDTRVVYVGNDPVVLAHAHTLKRSTPEGATAYVHGTLHDPDALWAAATETLDPTRPVGILVPVTLCLVPDEADPHGILRRLLDAVPSGSYLMIAQTSGDYGGEGAEGEGEGDAGPGARPMTAGEQLRAAIPAQYVVRDPAEIARFFDGLELVEPGLVPINAWRPTSDPPSPTLDFPMHAAVGRKP